MAGEAKSAATSVFLAPAVGAAAPPRDDGNEVVLATIPLRMDLLSKARHALPGLAPVAIECRKYFVPSAAAAASVAGGDDSGRAPDSSKPTLLLRQVERGWTAYSGGTAHALVDALLYSYNEHVPFHAYPHHVLMHLNSCVATHVSENAETLRSTMVAHEGKETLTVEATAAPGVPAVKLWEDMLTAFETLIAERTKTALTTHMNTHFTTSSRVSAAANRIATMAAMKNYFGYRFTLGCGVPNVVVHGEKKDWDALRTCYTAMRTILPSFNWWWSRMDRIIDAFCRMSGFANSSLGDGAGGGGVGGGGAASGAASGGAASGGGDAAATREADLESMREFWSTMATAERYGSGHQTQLSGWISDMLPYSESGQARWSLTSTRVPAIAHDAIPSSLVEAPAEINDHGDHIQLTLQAGFLGIAFHESDGGVSPAIGYSILQRASMEPPVPMTMEEFTRRVEEGKAKKSGSYVDPSQVARRHLLPWLKHVQPQCMEFFFGPDLFTFQLQWIGKQPEFSAHPAMVPIVFDAGKHTPSFRQHALPVRVYKHGIFTFLV